MNKLKVAWISEFPVEWLPDLPEPLQRLPRPHSMSWQRVLLEQFEKDPSLDLHIFAVRRNLGADYHFQRNGVSFHVVNVSIARAYTYYWPDTWALRPQLNEVRPDVVHAWGSERGAALVAQRLGLPHVLTVQGLMTWYAQLMKFNFHEKLAAHLERKCLPRASLVTTESTFAVNFLKQKFPRVRVQQVEHAPSWRFHRVQRQPQTRPIRFVFIGYVSERKGVDLLFAALERLCDELAFELVLVGKVDPRFAHSFERAKQSRLWQRVIYRESLTADEVAQELARATILLFPTRADTSPNAVKEAVVAAVPVVASSVGGITDYVFPASNGFLFPSEDLERFVQSIRQAVAHPLFGRGQVKLEALGHLREYLSPVVMAKRFREAYEIVLSGKR